MKRALFVIGFCGVVLAMQTGVQAAWTVEGGYNWESYNGKYYALTKTGNNASWDDVRQEALAVGGDLVVINDSAENNWLAATMFDSPDYQNLPGYDLGRSEHLWIGLSQPVSNDPDVDPAAGWEWVDGTALGWSSWAPGQPSDGGGLGGPAEDWTALKNDGFWNDYSPFGWMNFGYDGIQGIIEVDGLPVAPAPAAIALVGLGAACVSWLRKRRAL